MTLMSTVTMPELMTKKKVKNIPGRRPQLVQHRRWERAVSFTFCFKSRFRVEDVAWYRPRNFCAHSIA